jgi:hypothetical protein
MGQGKSELLPFKHVHKGTLGSGIEHSFTASLLLILI